MDSMKILTVFGRMPIYYRYDPVLEIVVTFTEELAYEQAAAADAEIKEGNFRSPLHGIPYGLKDLIAVPDYPTTWGAAPFKNQV